MRDNHTKIDHATNSPVLINALADSNPDDMQVILEDLVRANEVEAVKDYLSEHGGLFQFGRIGRREIFKAAVISFASPNMIETLVSSEDYDICRLQRGSINAAFDASNMDTIECLFNSTLSTLSTAAMACWISRAIQWQSEELISSAERAMGAVKMKYPAQDRTEFLTSCVLSKDCVAATAGQAEREALLLRLWKTAGVTGDQSFRKTLSGTMVSTLPFYTLVWISETTLSTNLAQAILEYGAQINGQWPTHPSFRTPLQIVSQKSSHQAARFARFLLYNGAAPETYQAVKGREGKKLTEKKYVRDERLPQEMSKWLGVTWDELVQKVKEDREAGIPWTPWTG